MPIGLVLADNHPLVLEGLEHLFRLQRGFKVLARCRDGEETLRAVWQHRPDVLILDIRMPGKSGLGVVQEMKKRKLSTRVVLLTAALDEAEVLEAIRLGVRGVVLKEMAPQLLVQCIRKVHSGGQWLEVRSFGHALENMVRREAGAREMADVLTPREIEIVRLVASGLRNKAIAKKLYLSVGTVKNHLHNVYEKLQVDGRPGLMRHAGERGLH